MSTGETMMLESREPPQAPTPLPPGALYRHCDPARFSFTTTAELEPLADLPGQERAAEAVQFGLGIRREGFNVYVLGPAGTGKRSLALQFTGRQAALEPTPPDWVYVNNFAEPHRPKALRLPGGRGTQLRQDVRDFVEELRGAVPAALEGEEYRARRQAIDQKFKEQHDAAFASLEERARKHGLGIIRSPVGTALAVMKDGEVLAGEEFNQLPDATRQQILADLALFRQELEAIMARVPQWESERREQVRALNRETIRFAVDHLIARLRERYADLPNVLEHLTVVEQDLGENAGQFLTQTQQAESTENALELGVRRALSDGEPFERYQVNLLVDHDGNHGAPVVEEPHPTLSNLVGRVEYRARFGNLVTDFTMIRPGALHRANGGYLILDARRVLLEPYAWEELKRALRAKAIEMRSVSEMLGLSNAGSLQPEPIPLEVKVVLTGDRLLYYLLCEFDPDFRELFKVAADFDERLERSPESELVYARLIATIAQREGLRPLEPGALARVIEHAARLSGDAQRVSMGLETVADLLREADHHCGLAGRTVMVAADVEGAIEAQIRRSSRVRERWQEEILRGTIIIATDGASVGQVNGLSVFELGGFSFGHPSRITARVRIGKGEVVDIEREVELGGPIHSKGVLILAGYLAGRFAQEHPLSLHASLVFEQSYGGVEGDSASLAELCAVLSALARAPIRQGVAITGSVNQHGEAQAIGGVNEKIEGFYEVCRARGLTGEQGVIVPEANVKHLMLRRDVIEAVREGRFKVWAVRHVDQAMTILSGLEPGQPDPDGRFPAGSLNQRVDARLADFAEKARSFGAPERREIGW